MKALTSTLCFVAPLAAIVLVGCTAPVGAGRLAVPENAGETCAAQCGNVGMKLAAIAIMAGNVGCICEPPANPAAGVRTSQSSATTAGGMAAIVQIEEQQRQQQQQYQYRRR